MNFSANMNSGLFKKLSTLFLIFTTTVLTISCGSGEKKSFENATWAFTDTLTTQFDIQNAEQFYHLIATPTFNDDYPYANLYLKIIWKTPKNKYGDLLLNFPTTDSMGNWIEEESWGKFAINYTLMDSLKFKTPGIYEYKIIHYMREDSLPGVESIELNLYNKEEE